MVVQAKGILSSLKNASSSLERAIEYTELTKELEFYIEALKKFHLIHGYEFNFELNSKEDQASLYKIMQDLDNK